MCTQWQTGASHGPTRLRPGSLRAALRWGCACALEGREDGNPGHRRKLTCPPAHGPQPALPAESGAAPFPVPAGGGGDGEEGKGVPGLDGLLPAWCHPVPSPCGSEQRASVVSPFWRPGVQTPSAGRAPLPGEPVGGGPDRCFLLAPGGRSGRLWSPWRADASSSPRDARCPFRSLAALAELIFKDSGWRFLGFFFFLFPSRNSATQKHRESMFRAESLGVRQGRGQGLAPGLMGWEIRASQVRSLHFSLLTCEVRACRDRDKDVRTKGLDTGD